MRLSKTKNFFPTGKRSRGVSDSVYEPALVPASRFPVIERERRAGRIYLDSAATAQKPDAVIRRVAEFERTAHGPVHRGIHRLSVAATDAFEAARAKLGRFINAAAPEHEIVLCRGATEAVNLAAHAWGNAHVSAGDEIVVTTMEHHSNLVPWHLLAKRNLAKIVEVKPVNDGTLSMESLMRAMGPRTKLVALTHVSNLLGTINDVKRAATIAHAAGAILLVDGAQALGHLPVNVRDLECDLYAGSGHKMFGPTGTGFLYGRREVLETFEPFMGGGDMIEAVFIDRSTYRGIPARLEAGTPNISGVVGLGAAVDFLTEVGMNRVRAHDRALTKHALDKLGRLPFIDVYGPRDPELRSGLVSFNVRGIHAHDVGTLLDELGVAVRTGHLCAQPMIRHLGKSSCVRAGFALYNDADSIDRLVSALVRAAEYFKIT